MPRLISKEPNSNLLTSVPITFIDESSHPSSVDALFMNESIFKNQLMFDVCTKKFPQHVH